MRWSESASSARPPVTTILRTLDSRGAGSDTSSHFAATVRCEVDGLAAKVGETSGSRSTPRALAMALHCPWAGAPGIGRARTNAGDAFITRRPTGTWASKRQAVRQRPGGSARPLRNGRPLRRSWSGRQRRRKSWSGCRCRTCERVITRTNALYSRHHRHVLPRGAV